MKYSELVSLYDALSKTTKMLEKTRLLAEFLPRLKERTEWIYLLRGRVLPHYDVREFGISTQLTIKAIAKSSGLTVEKVAGMFNKIGDLGDVAAELAEKKRQHALFHAELIVDKVFTQLQKIVDIDGKGSVDKKLDIIVELLTHARADEARYLIRTVLNDLRVGVADALLLDALALAFLDNEPRLKEKLEEAYDLSNDFALVFELCQKGERGLAHVRIKPGKPINVMLPVKVTDLEEAFRICGKPAAIEHKYDGFRMVISRDKDEIKLFTRRLENVTAQFPDVVACVKEHVKGSSFILDSEVVGYDSVKKKYMPFESISQRIRRKYDIDALIKKLPVEINVFDIVYYEGESWLDKPFFERRALLEKIVRAVAWKIKPSRQFVSGDEKKVEEFYKEALKLGEEGIMIKKIDAPYRAGRRVGYMAKLKPQVADLDVVIVGAEYGTGKRAGGLTSFIVACRNGAVGEFLEIGKVSSGLKEKAEEGTTYTELNELLQPLVLSTKGNTVRVRPKVVVSVTYQNIQHSPSYSSGFAMRFPRITHYRPDRSTKDIATLEDIKKEVLRGQRLRKRGVG